MAKQLMDVIGCCICLGIPQAWIHQCENGHSYCDKCHTVQSEWQLDIISMYLQPRAAQASVD